MSELTYPTIVGHRILELTEAQREAVRRKYMTPEERQAELLARIDELERKVEILLDRI